MLTNAFMLPVGKTLSPTMDNMSFVCVALFVFMRVVKPTPAGYFPWFS